jgi:hypothetical protein
MQRVYEKNPGHYNETSDPAKFQRLVLCGDREHLKPKAKKQTQEKRDNANKTVPYPNDCEYTIEQGDMFILPKDGSRGRTEKINVLRLISTRELRSLLFQFIFERLIRDTTIPPGTEIIFDCIDQVKVIRRYSDKSLDSKTIDPYDLKYEYKGENEVVSTILNYTFLFDSPLRGEADISITMHVLHAIFIECRPHRIAIFTTDSDVTALISAHILDVAKNGGDEIINASRIDSIYHHNKKVDYAITEEKKQTKQVYDIKTIVDALISKGFTRKTFLTLCIMMGTDFTNKIPEIGPDYILRGCLQFKDDVVIQQLIEPLKNKSFLDLMTFRQLVRFILYSKQCRKSQSVYKPVNIRSTPSDDILLLYRQYVGNIRYWTELEEENADLLFE